MYILLSRLAWERGQVLGCLKGEFGESLSRNGADGTRKIKQELKFETGDYSGYIANDEPAV